jgi:hypothetical protein
MIMVLFKLPLLCKLCGSAGIGGVPCLDIGGVPCLDAHSVHSHALTAKRFMKSSKSKLGLRRLTAR